MFPLKSDKTIKRNRIKLNHFMYIVTQVSAPVIPCTATNLCGIKPAASQFSWCSV